MALEDEIAAIFNLHGSASARRRHDEGNVVRLFKIGAVVRVTARRVWVNLSSAFPLQQLFAEVASRLVMAT